MSDLGLTVLLIGLFVVLALALHVMESSMHESDGRPNHERDGQGRQPTAAARSVRKT